MLTQAYLVVLTLIVVCCFNHAIGIKTITLVGYPGHILKYDLSTGIDCRISSVKMIPIAPDNDDSLPYWISLSSLNVLTILPRTVEKRTFFVMLFGNTIGYYVKLCQSYYLEIKVLSNFFKGLDERKSNVVNNLNSLNCLNSSLIHILSVFIEIPLIDHNKTHKIIKLSQTLGGILRLQNSMMQLVPYNSPYVMHQQVHSISIHASRMFKDTNNELTYTVSFLLDCKHTTSDHRRHIFRRSIQDELQNLDVNVTSMHLSSGVLERQRREVFFGTISALVGTPVESSTLYYFSTTELKTLATSNIKSIESSLLSSSPSFGRNSSYNNTLVSELFSPSRSPHLTSRLKTRLLTSLDHTSSIAKFPVSTTMKNVNSFHQSTASQTTGSSSAVTFSLQTKKTSKSIRLLTTVMSSRSSLSTYSKFTIKLSGSLYVPPTISNTYHLSAFTYVNSLNTSFVATTKTKTMLSIGSSNKVIVTLLTTSSLLSFLNTSRPSTNSAVSSNIERSQPVVNTTNMITEVTTLLKYTVSSTTLIRSSIVPIKSLATPTKSSTTAMRSSTTSLGSFATLMTSSTKATRSFTTLMTSATNNSRELSIYISKTIRPSFLSTTSKMFLNGTIFATVKLSEPSTLIETNISTTVQISVKSARTNSTVLKPSFSMLPSIISTLSLANTKAFLQTSTSTIFQGTIKSTPTLMFSIYSNPTVYFSTTIFSLVTNITKTTGYKNSSVAVTTILSSVSDTMRTTSYKNISVPATTIRSSISDIIRTTGYKYTSVPATTILSSVSDITRTTGYKNTSVTATTILSSVSDITRTTGYKNTSVTATTILSSVSDTMRTTSYKNISVPAMTILSSVSDLIRTTGYKNTSIPATTILSSVSDITRTTGYKTTSVTATTILSSVSDITRTTGYKNTSVTATNILSSVSDIMNTTGYKNTSIPATAILSSVSDITRTNGYKNTSVPATAILSSISDIMRTTGYKSTSIPATAILSSVSDITRTTGYKNSSVPATTILSSISDIIRTTGFGYKNTSIPSTAILSSVSDITRTTGYKNTSVPSTTILSSVSDITRTTGYKNTSVLATAILSSISDLIRTTSYKNISVSATTILSSISDVMRTTGYKNTSVPATAIFSSVSDVVRTTRYKNTSDFTSSKHFLSASIVTDTTSIVSSILSKPYHTSTIIIQTSTTTASMTFKKVTSSSYHDFTPSSVRSFTIVSSKTFSSEYFRSLSTVGTKTSSVFRSEISKTVTFSSAMSSLNFYSAPLTSTTQSTNVHPSSTNVPPSSSFRTSYIRSSQKVNTLLTLTQTITIQTLETPIIVTTRHSTPVLSLTSNNLSTSTSRLLHPSSIRRFISSDASIITINPSTSLLHNTTTAISTSTTAATPTPNHLPVVRNSIGQVIADTGRLFNYQVPEDTFFDLEDGGTRNLTLNAYTDTEDSLDKHNWLLFTLPTQTFSGVPLITDFQTQGNRGITIRLVATDKWKNYALDIFQIIIMEPMKSLSFTISVTLALDYKTFLSSKNLRQDILTRISQFYRSQYTEDLYIESITEGSTVLSWTNTSSGVVTCQRNEIQHTIDAVQVPHTISPSKDFARFMLPEFPVIGINSNFLGPCNTSTTKQPVTISQSSNSDNYLYYVVPITILGIILLIILIIVLFLWKHRRKETFFKDGRTYERGKPVLLPDEVELKSYPSSMQLKDTPKAYSNKIYENDEMDGVSLSSGSSYSSYSSDDFIPPGEAPPGYVIPPVYRPPYNERNSRI